MPVDDAPSQRFVRRLIGLRRRRGLTQERVAAMSGMTRQALAKTEVATRKLTLNDAVALAAALGTSVDEMCGPDPLVISDPVVFD